MKYAFEGKETGAVTVFVRKKSEQVVLQVKDDGIGMPAETDIETVKSFGLRLLSILTEQLDGSLEINRKDGTTITITFPGEDV